MNKVILKEKQKKGEKKQEKSVKITKEIIEERLLNHFKHHIGEEEKTTQEEIFQIVIGVNSYQVDSFTRFYWWDSIAQVIRKLRRQNKAFIIKKNGHYFVLKSENEALYYRGLCEKSIKHMENAIIRADTWVANESWTKLENPKSILVPALKSTDEQVEEDVENAKRKIVKLWKGEQ